jgi:FkbM family methyltransferase
MEELYNLDLIKNYSEFLELNKLIKRGDRILEVGSNQGFFFTFMSKLVGVDGYVVGLEPLPKNAIIACSQIGLNDNSSFTAILNAAASFDSSNVFLTRSSHNASVAERNINNTVETKSITCDSLLETYKSFDLIKIDVEGYEENVLKGCQKILETKPKLAIELHMPFIKKYNSTLSNIFNLININHYDGTMIFRKDKTKSYPFDPKLINNDVINLFLKPKVNI